MKPSAENNSWEKEFFDRFGANKIWVTPSRDNVETVLEIHSFLSTTLEKSLEEQRGNLEKDIERLLVGKRRLGFSEDTIGAIEEVLQIIQNMK